MYKGKKVIHLVARGLNGEIGANNKLLWNIPEDLRFFKDSTIGHVVLMGRNTFDSLPKPLSRRICMCVSTKYSEKYPTWLLEEALFDGESYSDFLKTDKIFIAGGSQIYNSTFDIVDELWITQVEKEYLEADTLYHIPKDFKLVDEVYGNECESVGIGYSFQKWVKV